MIILSSSPLFANRYPCAELESRSKGSWIDFTYTTCEDGAIRTEHPGWDGLAYVKNAAVGTPFAIGHSLTNENVTPGQIVRPGKNSFLCEQGKFTTVCNRQ